MLFRFGNTWRYRFHFTMGSGRTYVSPWVEISDHPRDDGDSDRTERQRAWTYAWREARYETYWVLVPDSPLGGGRINDGQIELMQLELLKGELEETAGQVSYAPY